MLWKRTIVNMYEAFCPNCEATSFSQVQSIWRSGFKMSWHQRRCSIWPGAWAYRKTLDFPLQCFKCIQNARGSSINWKGSRTKSHSEGVDRFGKKTWWAFCARCQFADSPPTNPPVLCQGFVPAPNAVKPFGRKDVTVAHCWVKIMRHSHIVCTKSCASCPVISLSPNNISIWKDSSSKIFETIEIISG